MRELLSQMGLLEQAVSSELKDPASSILDIERKVTAEMRSDSFPTDNFGAALGGSLIPWIDKASSVKQDKRKKNGKAMQKPTKS